MTPNPLLDELRAAWPTRTRVAARQIGRGTAFTGTVVGYAQTSTSYTGHRVFVVVRCEDGTRRDAAPETLMRLPHLSAHQKWTLVVALEEGGIVPHSSTRLPKELLTHHNHATCGGPQQTLSPHGVLVARALAPTARPPHLGPRQRAALTDLRRIGGTLLNSPQTLKRAAITPADLDSLLRLHLIDHVTGNGRHYGKDVPRPLREQETHHVINHRGHQVLETLLPPARPGRAAFGAAASTWAHNWLTSVFWVEDEVGGNCERLADRALALLPDMAGKALPLAVNIRGAVPVGVHATPEEVAHMAAMLAQAAGELPQALIEHALDAYTGTSAEERAADPRP